MTDLIQQAAEVLVPLVSAGAGVASTEVAKRMGGELFEAASRLWTKARAFFSGQYGSKEIADALKGALEAGAVPISELHDLVALSQQQDARIHNEVHSIKTQGGSAFVGNQIRVGGDFKVGGDRERGRD